MLWNTFTDEVVRLLTVTDRFDCAELPTFTNMLHSFVGAEAESEEAYACSRCEKPVANALHPPTR